MATILPIEAYVFACMITAVIVMSVVFLWWVPADHNAQVRSWDDPTVSTHAFALVPLFIAIRKGMWTTAAVLGIATFISLIYHRYMEQPGGRLLDSIDMASAYFLAVWTVVLLTVSMFRAPSVVWTTLVLITACSSAVLFYTQPRSDTKDVYNCRHEKLHPMWHISAFAGITFVLLNYEPSVSWAGAAQWKEHKGLNMLQSLFG